MSETLTLAQMITDVKSRIPIGLADAYVQDRINEAYRWLCQQEAYVWNLRREQVAVDQDTVDFPLPKSADPGDPMSLYGSSFKIEIPFIPFERFSQQHGFTTQMPSDCPFSAWTIVSVQGTSYVGKLAPDTPLAAPFVLTLFYHARVAPVTDTTQYFPSPDEFDSLLVDLTEAEIKRRYHMAGFEMIQQKASEQVKKLADVYRSSKRTIQGMADQAMRSQEAALKRAE